MVVVGGGPGGLSAALWLGRSCRRTLLVDAGGGRNAAARGSARPADPRRDGASGAPRSWAAKLCERYEVEYRDDHVAAIRRVGEGFELELASGGRVASRAVILATGVCDRLPQIPGLDESLRQERAPLPVLRPGALRAEVSCRLRQGAGGVRIGRATSPAGRGCGLHRRRAGARGAEAQPPRALGIAVDPSHGSSASRARADLGRIRFADGSALERRALFFTLGWDQGRGWAFDLACSSTRKGCIATDERGRTGVRGLFVVGDSSRDVQLVVVAAAEGAKVAIHLHEQLLEEDLKLRASVRAAGAP